MEKLIKQLHRLILHPEKQLYAIQSKDGFYMSKKNKVLIDGDVRNHISGKITVGIKLLQPGNNMAKAGCIDFDNDSLDLQQALEQAQKTRKVALEKEIPCYIEFSGRRGFHLWFFSSSPIPGKVWRRALSVLCKLSLGSTSFETFPSSDFITEEGKGESKCIKLPLGIHRLTGKRSSFITSDEKGVVFKPEKQAELMATFEQLDPEKLLQLITELRDTTHEYVETPVDFSPLSQSEHPDCINYILLKGCPRDQWYSHANFTLARYANTRGMTYDEAMELAEKMAENTSPAHPTDKTFEEKIDDFKSALESVKQKPELYNWSCSYIRASDVLKKDGGCLGWDCRFWPWGKKKELQLPLIKPSPADFASEREIFNYIIKNPNSATKAYSMNIPLDGFITKIEMPEGEVPVGRILWDQIMSLAAENCDVSQAVIMARIEKFDENLLEPIEKYLDDVKREPSCSSEVFNSNLKRLKNNGLNRLLFKYSQDTMEAIGHKYDVSVIIDNLSGKLKSLKKIAGHDIQSMYDELPLILEQIFSAPNKSMPLPFEDMTCFFDGGWKEGELYVLLSFFSNLRSDFSGWIADFLAKEGWPVLYLSFYRSRKELFVNSILRIGNINIEEAVAENKILEEDLKRIILEYEQNISKKMVVFEPSSDFSTEKLEDLIKQVRLKMALPNNSPLMVIIDYLDLMMSRNYGRDNMSLQSVLMDIKHIGRNNNVSIIVLGESKSDINTSLYNYSSGDCIFLLEEDEDKESKRRDFPSGEKEVKLITIKPAIKELLLTYKEENSSFM